MQKHPEWDQLTTDQKLDWLHDQAYIVRDELNAVRRRFDSFGSDVASAISKVEDRVKALEASIDSPKD